MKATKFWTILTLFILCATLTGVSRVETAEIDGINFDNRYSTADTSLKLRGTGILRVMVFAKIYVAALYLPEDYPSKLALSDVPKRLEVEYLRPVAGKDFGPATNKKVSENVDQQTFRRLQPRLEYHNSLYRDVRAGDRCALTYIPGKGTELTINDEPRGTIEGADFAAALFSIWLGPKPISESLKKELLDLS